MSSLEQLYAAAHRRRADLGLTYAGALTPAESFELLQLDPKSRLVDVRTRAELDWIGRPLMEDGQYLHIEWSRYPGGTPNPDFIEQLTQAVQPDTTVLLLCRSAARSKAAAKAAAAAGFTGMIDILEGFEGDKDGNGHRKTVGGWCFQGLPWIGA
jgi:rhodanese-related sulfurtransferase